VIVIHRAGAAHGAGPRIAARTGVALHNHFDSVGQSSASLSEQDIKTLSMDPEVDYVAPDSPLKAFALDKGRGRLAPMPRWRLVFRATVLG
jgi:hypothetical protein